MKTFTAFSFVALFFMSTFAFAEDQCSDLFTTKVTTDSLRTSMAIEANEDGKSKLRVEELKLSSDPKEAALELVRMILNNRSYALDEKNVLLKNKIEIGIPLTEGLTFIVNYESKSMTEPKFVIEDKILLVSTNKELKVTENLLDDHSYSLAKTEFNLPEIMGKEYAVTLKVPLTIEKEVLEKLDDYSKYFDHIQNKEKLRKILNLESPVKRMALLKLERAKVMFLEAFVKSPYKMMANAIFMGVIAAGSNYVINNYHDIPPFPHARVQQIIQSTEGPVAGVTANEAAEARQQLYELQVAANDKANEKSKVEQNKKATPADLKLNSFTLDHSAWIQNVKDPKNGTLHTYIVFAQDRTVTGDQDAVQFMTMEVNRVQNNSLIKYINAQQKLPN